MRASTFCCSEVDAEAMYPEGQFWAFVVNRSVAAALTNRGSTVFVYPVDLEDFRRGALPASQDRLLRFIPSHNEGSKISMGERGSAAPLIACCMHLQL